MINNLNNKAGFTLVEVLVAIILTGLAFMMFLQALNTGKMVRIKSELRTRQSIILNSVENQIRARKFDENDSAPWTSIEALGKDGDEITISQFDDIDDFHDYTVNSIDGNAGFGYSVKVFYGTPPSHPLVDGNRKVFISSTNKTNYKNVAISVVHATLSTLSDTLVITPKW